MRKIAIVLLSFSLLFSTLTQPVQAASTCEGNPQGFGTTLQNGANSHTVSMNLGSYSDGGRFQFKIQRPGDGSVLADTPFFTVGEDGEFSNDGGTVTIQGSRATWVITKRVALEETNNSYTEKREVSMFEWPGIFGVNRVCNLGIYTAAEFSSAPKNTQCEIYIYQERSGEKCYSSGCLTAGGVRTYIEGHIENEDGTPYNEGVFFDIAGPGLGVNNFARQASNGVVTGDFRTSNKGTYAVILRKNISYTPSILTPGEILCSQVSFKVSDNSECGNICGEKVSAYEKSAQPNFDLCNQIADKDANTKCIDCFGDGGIWTAIGCIPTEPTSIIKTLITLGLSLGGGITLLLILAGAFRLSVSAGDPKQAEEAKEQITSAIIGLLFIIFSVVMLRFIGIQVLQIPGFGG